MTRVWSEGWEMQDLVGYSLTTYATINTTTKRSGAASLKLEETGYLNYNITGISELYLRFGLYWESTSSVQVFRLIWRNSSTELGDIYIDLNGTAKLRVNGSTVDTGTIVISQSAWYLIELRIKIADAGEIELKIDGVSDASYSGDTKPGAATTIDNLRFYDNSSGLGENTLVYLDDIGLNSTAGAVDNSWLGDGKIIVIKPNGDSATLELTPSAAVAHNTLVDDIPADGDTTYVEGSVDDERDIYDLAACGLSDVIITRIWTEARAKDTGSSGKAVALITKASGGAEVSGGDVALAGTYTIKVVGAAELVNPVDAAAWEVADIDALQGGPMTRP